MSSSYATITYTSMSRDNDVPSWGIPFMDAYESDPEAPEAAPQSPDQAPLHQLMLLYIQNSKLVEEDHEESPTEETFEEEEELSTPLVSPPNRLYIDLPSKGTDVSPTSDPLPSSVDALVDSWVGAPTPSLPPPSPLSPLSSTLPRIPSPPLLLPPPTRRDIIPDDDMPPRKRARFAALSCRFEIGESLTAVVARQPWSTFTQGTDYGFVTALEEVNERVTDLATSHRHDSEEFHVRHRDAQDDRAALRARVSSLERQIRYHHTMAIVTEQEAIFVQRTIDREDARDPKCQDGPADAGSRNGGGRTSHTARVCTYKEFLKCQPLNFKGTEGAIGLAYWLEKMESGFHISNCTIECQVKYATCTLLGSALTWWDSHDRTVGHDVGKLQMLYGSLMDQKLLTYATRQAENKRKMDNNSRNNHVQQPPYKRPNVARAYDVGPGKKREYVGTLPLCKKCKFHHNGPCAAKYTKCKRVGHLARDCRRHYKSDCPKLKNKTHGNTDGNGEARRRAYALGGGEPNPNSNIVTRDKCDGRNESRLNIISCTKTQKYLLKGCHVFLARITEKKTEEKSKEK
ncbi:hypothetical protein Tco_0944123 [Tanacetum coccineum]